MSISKLEFWRQIVHIATGLVLVFLVHIEMFTVEFLFIALPILLVIAIMLKAGYVPFASEAVELLERPEDMPIMPGRSVYATFVAIFLLLLWFPKPIILAALTIWAIGDGLNHLVGAGLGRIPVPFNPDKNIEGPIVAILVAGAAATYFVGWQLAFPAAVIGMLVDLHHHTIRGWHIPDNLTIPLAAAVTMVFTTAIV